MAYCTQPYFPPQITFYIVSDNYKILIAVDEINQQAYQMYSFGLPPVVRLAFAMKQFPYAIPDSPESKNYVQLISYFSSHSCEYGTYWKYGHFYPNTFPSHWNFNTTTFKIDNYIQFNYPMIHSEDNSTTEDYWYSNEICEVYSGAKYPCEEIYFVKNTDRPLRQTKVVRQASDLVQITTIYQVVSISQPDPHLFNTIPKNWAYDCTDTTLAVLYEPQIPTIKLNESLTVKVALPSPPHRINGNDTVIIRWEVPSYSKCQDCIIWTPERLSFNDKNFQEIQTLTLTRVKNGNATLVPNFSGGGFEKVIPGNNAIVVV